MKMEVKKEAPAFVLWGSSYNGCGEDVVVSYADLRAAEIGKMWVGSDSNNCGRAVHRESAEVEASNKVSAVGYALRIYLEKHGGR